VTDLRLPAGTQYALTVNIPENYGGMTSSMLQRSRAFVTHAGAEVTILTYEHRDDYEPVRKRLRDRGAMIDGMHLVNFWEQLAEFDADTLATAAPGLDVPLDFEPLGARGAAVDERKRQLLADDGAPLQIDYFRPDGSLLLTDRAHGPVVKARRLTLCNASGEPMRAWTHMFPLYALWLDQLPRNPVAWIIVESKSSANMMIRYDRPDVAKLHVVRGSHLRTGPGTPLERDLVNSRKPVMENIDAWDALVLLTNRQREDVEARFGQRDNVTVLPNSRNMPLALTRSRRRPGRGVMLASLDGRKRIAHAIQAVSRARKVGRRRVMLDVWGQGPLKADLQALIKKLDAPVTLRGHSPTAAEEFGKASFSLLTSRTEALPGVLLESMGRGCIPISYDLPYGPSDIITHGVDGFLVPFGDIEALADQIAQVVAMPQKDLTAMRQAAHRRALDFSDERAVERWSGLMSDIAKRREFTARPR
jgi:poly(glycerol-phosphate) alpha-glucosyltransferase